MNTPGTSQTTLRDLLGNLRTGLLVVADELKWIVLRGLRSLEIRQMEKRLAEEQAALGQAVAEAVAGQEAPASAPLGEAAHLCLKQIAFLGEELAYLRAERDRLRQDLLERRRSTLAPDGADKPGEASQPGKPESPEE